MEESDSFAILDINISDDKDSKVVCGTTNTDENKSISPFKTVIKIRKLKIYKIFL